jgi:hypothetical protein
VLGICRVRSSAVASGGSLAMTCRPRLRAARRRPPRPALRRAAARRTRPSPHRRGATPRGMDQVNSHHHHAVADVGEERSPPRGARRHRGIEGPKSARAVAPAILSSIRQPHTIRPSSVDQRRGRVASVTTSPPTHDSSTPRTSRQDRAVRDRVHPRDERQYEAHEPVHILFGGSLTFSLIIIGCSRSPSDSAGGTPPARS